MQRNERPGTPPCGHMMYSFISAAESFHASVKRIVFVAVSRLAMVESREA
jgi:hypothetical protein